MLLRKRGGVVEKKELVVKSNRLVEARYKLNLVEQQIILYSLCRSREDERGLSPLEPVTISAANFAAQFGTNETKVYGQLREAMDTLYERSITIHDTDPKTGFPRVTKTRWISEASYIDGAGQIQIIFAPKVIPFITRLGEGGNFTSYLLERIGNMTSGHAIRLYELLVQYQGAGSRALDIADLKETIGLEPTEYSAIKDFKKRVIDLAVGQINKHSDIRVSYENIKAGRVVTGLLFRIEAAKPPAPADVPGKPPARRKKAVIDRAYIEKHARVGESYDQAYRRLLEEQGQGRLVG